MTINSLELRHLRVFSAVAESLNFSHAAQACKISQSSVSTIIQQLEEELGVRLIDRTTRRVTLSRLGEEFLPGAQRILSEFDRQIEGMRSLKALDAGMVHVACVPSVAMRLVPQVVRRFRLQHGQVAIKIHEVSRGRSVEMVRTVGRSHEMVRTGEADLAIANEPPGLSELESQPLMEDIFALVLRRDHPLAGRRHVNWVDARDAGLLMMAPRTGIRLEIEHGLPEGLLQNKVAYEAENPSTLLAMATQGIGVAPLPSLAWPSVSDPQLTVRPLCNPVVRRGLHVIWRANRSLSPAAAVFRKYLTEEAKALEAEVSAQAFT